jgi:pyrimidine deaminase RibD-like protein
LILGDGYSRQIPGNTHAEANALTNFRTAYAALLRDARQGSLPPADEVLPEVDCYATMEPCSVRTSGGPSCALELVRARVKTVYLVSAVRTEAERRGAKRSEESWSGAKRRELERKDAKQSEETRSGVERRVARRSEGRDAAPVIRFVLVLTPVFVGSRGTARFRPVRRCQDTRGRRGGGEEGIGVGGGVSQSGEEGEGVGVRRGGGGGAGQYPYKG